MVSMFCCAFSISLLHLNQVPECFIRVSVIVKNFDYYFSLFSISILMSCVFPFSFSGE